ncbi:MAG: tetratricopeptide repeat protein [Nitrospinae bacterium]|nr:tetratricopeptide repeat protein [Nitrospinota bacterium]
MPKPIKKKIVKKTTFGSDASGTLSRLKKSVDERKRFFITAVAAVVLSVIAIGGFFLYSNTQKNKAQKLEYEAYKIYYGLYQKQPVASEERYKKAAEIFRKAYDVRKSPVSLYYIANCNYELGKYEESLNALKDLNRKFPDDEKFVPLSYYKMAMISLKKGSAEEALKSFAVLYNYKTGTYKDLALIESGKILEAQGKAEEAKKKYEELVKDFPQSPFAEEAKARIERKKG